jgi:hypothetical protein
LKAGLLVDAEFIATDMPTAAFHLCLSQPTDAAELVRGFGAGTSSRPVAAAGRADCFSPPRAVSARRLRASAVPDQAKPSIMDGDVASDE